MESDLTFEELIKNSFDKNLLGTSIEELNLAVRSLNGLRNAGLKTIENIVDFGFHTLRKKKNIGVTTIDDIKDAILEIQKRQMDKKRKISFVDAISSIISSVTPQYLSVIKARYGYDGECKTLEEIGKQKGITREWVRQVLDREIRRIKHITRKETFRTPIENIERLLFQFKGILSINDITKDKYFINGTHKQIRFLINLIIEFYENRYRIIDKYFLTSLNDNEIKALQSKIRNTVLKCRFPIDKDLFIKNMQSSMVPLSKDYLSYHLLYQNQIEIWKGQIYSLGRLSIAQRLKILMRHVNKPMHFTEIARLYRDHLEDTKIRLSDRELVAIYARIRESKDFIAVDRGTFMLRDRFKVPKNIETIVARSKKILKNLRVITDTRYLVNELTKQNIDVGNLNAHSLKSILLEYPDFVGYRQFEIGLEGLAVTYDRKPLGDLIYGILLSFKKPVHFKTIWKEISKKRGFPENTIECYLCNDPKFIRVAPSTYTVAENIERYEENGHDNRRP